MEVGAVSDYQKIEKAEVAREARDAAGRPRARSSKADILDAALMRYLAAEEYHEHIEEKRGSEDAADGPPAEHAPDP